MKGTPFPTGYEFTYREIEELGYEQKKRFIEEVEGCLYCEKCGYETKNPQERFFTVGLINNYLPDSRLWCEKCVREKFPITMDSE